MHQTCTLFNLVKRPICMFLLLMLTQHLAGAQSAEIVIGDTYEFKKPIIVSKYNLLLKRVDSVKVNSDSEGDRPIKTTVSYFIPSGYRFIVMDVVSQGVVIHFLRFSENVKSGSKLDKTLTPTKTINNLLVNRNPADSTQRKNNALVSGESNAISIMDPSDPTQEPLFFLVSSNDLSQKITRRYNLSGWRPEVAGGTVILPVKTRFAPFDFRRDFALGLTVGPRWRISHYQNHYLNALFAFNANIISVDSASTAGKVRRPADLGALGTGLGLVFDFNGPQIGVFSGFDWLSHRDQVANNWQYQGKAWLSIGVGFTLFTRNVGAAPTAPSQTQPTPTATPTSTR